MESTTPQNNQPRNKSWITRKTYFWIIGISVVAGVIGGYLYYFFIGCRNGCAIQSSPYLSMVWGGAIFYLIADMVFKPKKG